MICTSKPLWYTKYTCLIISIQNYVVGFNKSVKILECKEKQNNTEKYLVNRGSLYYFTFRYWYINLVCLQLSLHLDFNLNTKNYLIESYETGFSIAAVPAPQVNTYWDNLLKFVLLIYIYIFSFSLCETFVGAELPLTLKRVRAYRLGRATLLECLLHNCLWCFGLLCV